VHLKVEKGKTEKQRNAIGGAPDGAEEEALIESSKHGSQKQV